MKIKLHRFAILSLLSVFSSFHARNVIAEEQPADSKVKAAEKLDISEFSKLKVSPEKADIKLNTELEGLLSKMEAACKKSQMVFKPLSVAQMNFKPSDGTHTPRWNAEHLYGRQLQFFSQIYHSIDPENFEVVELYPAQMPKDYVAAHPEWSGEKEAEQMKKISRYIRTYAYLLNDLDLDKKVEGTNWSPRKLCQVMTAHFAEHTANVQKKFKLADWPSN